MERVSEDRIDDSRERLKTKGYLERAILEYLYDETNHQPPRPRTRAAGVQDVYSAIENYQFGSDGVVAETSARRAFHRLVDKGLVEDVTETPTGDSFYTVSPRYEPTDGRTTEWVLTPDGADEVRRLDQIYRAELEKLTRRFGRPMSQLGVLDRLNLPGELY